MESCLFCKIVNKEISAEIIYEDKFVLSFLDNHPVCFGHTLVIPKKHYKVLTDLGDEELGFFFKGLKNTVLLLEEKISPDGFNIGVNQGEKAGQVVPHLHFHILPRFENDGGANIQYIVNNPPKLSLKEIKERIINAN